MFFMESQTILIQKILDGLIEKVEQTKEELKTQGSIPKKLCQFCKTNQKRAITNFTPRDQIALKQLKNWIQENHVIAIETNFEGNHLFKIPNRLKGKTPIATDQNGFVYMLPDPFDTRSVIAKHLGTYPKIRNFLSKYDEIKSCSHFEETPKNILNIVHETPREKNLVAFRAHIKISVPSNLLEKEKRSKLFLCCDDCKKNIENSMCDTVQKRGFLYDFECPLEDIFLRKQLTENGLFYEDLEEESERERAIYFNPRHSSIYYLKENSIVIIARLDFGARRLDERMKDIIKYLKQKLLVVLGDQSNLPVFLEYQTNTLFYNEKGFFFYDKNRDVETDIQRICELIQKNLNVYIEKNRGKEHDRIISAMCSIGQDLGYIHEKEHVKAGVRIDCVWFDRKGVIQVAIEVETSSTWKKDLISTWEVDPKLAILIGSAKSDKVSENLIKSSLMKTIPHYVLYINKTTDHAFLFEKQRILKFYDCKKIVDEEGSSTLKRL